MFRKITEPFFNKAKILGGCFWTQRFFDLNTNLDQSRAGGHLLFRNNAASEIPQNFGLCVNVYTTHKLALHTIVFISNL